MITSVVNRITPWKCVMDYWNGGVLVKILKVQYHHTVRQYCIVGTTKEWVCPQNDITQKLASIFPDNDEVGKTKPKQALRLTRNAFNKLIWNCLKIY